MSLLAAKFKKDWIKDNQEKVETSRLHIILSLRKINEPVHEISNNVVCATSKAPDQPAHTRSLIRAFASRLSIL